MQAMIGFKNIAVHDHREIQMPIVQAMVERHLGDFQNLVTELKRAT